MKEALNICVSMYSVGGAGIAGGRKHVGVQGFPTLHYII